MIQGKQVQKILQLLNCKEQSLEDISFKFINHFSQTINLFNASLALMDLIQLLTPRQRIPALFILIQAYKNQGIKRNPFVATIYHTSQRPVEAYQRKLIAEIILDNKRQKYAKSRIDTLYDEQQSMAEAIQERAQIKRMRDQFICSLPKISQSKKSQVFGVVPDFYEKDKQSVAPDYQVNPNTLSRQQLEGHGFKVGFMRPTPQFLQISPSQFNWIYPGLSIQTKWDDSPHFERKALKPRAFLKKGIDAHLQKQQCRQIEVFLDLQHFSVLYLQFPSQQISQLIKNNPFVAVNYLVKLSNFPIVTEYLQAILQGPITLNSIQVVTRISKCVKLEPEFLESFLLKSMKQVLALNQTHKDRSKLAKFVANFFKVVLKGKIGEIPRCEELTEQFFNAFLDLEQVQTLRKIYKP